MDHKTTDFNKFRITIKSLGAEARMGVLFRAPLRDLATKKIIKLEKLSEDNYFILVAFNSAYVTSEHFRQHE